jgi:WD repeat-containing protein 23
MINLTSCFFVSVHRRNRDLPIDAATQYFTLHLYSTKELGQVKAVPASQVDRAHARRQQPAGPANARPLRVGAGQQDDDDEDDGMPWGNWGSVRSGRAAPQEDSSMKKIKTVQGEEGRWTVTDCDADKKAEK